MENKEYYIDCDGIKLHAKLDFPKEEKEKYPVVIIIHGFTGHMEERHIAGLASAVNEHGYASLRVEMFGHGKSEGTFKEHHLLLWISELIRVIDHAGSFEWADGLYLAGHSQGGAAIIIAGAIMEDRLEAIIPLSPAVSMKDDAKAKKFFGTFMEPLPDVVDTWKGELNTNHSRVGRYVPFEECSENFKKPVLLVHAVEDQSVPYECSQRLLKSFPNAELVTIHGDDHCYNSHLDQVLNAVTDFLDEMRK